MQGATCMLNTHSPSQLVHPSPFLFDFVQRMLINLTFLYQNISFRAVTLLHVCPADFPASFIQERFKEHFLNKSCISVIFRMPVMQPWGFSEAVSWQRAGEEGRRQKECWLFNFETPIDSTRMFLFLPSCAIASKILFAEMFRQFKVLDHQEFHCSLIDK